MKKGAIFDMDGLLIDSEKIWQNGWKRIAAKRNLVLAEDFTLTISGSSGEIQRKIVEKYFHVSTEEAGRIIEEENRQVREELGRCVPVKPGAEEILRWMNDHGVCVSVASSSARSAIDANLKQAGLISYFSYIVSGQDIRRGKPAPDIFLKAAREMNLPPEDCYVFEDSFNGVRAAHAAGCAAVMVPDLLQPDDEIHRLAAGVFVSLRDALHAIEEGKI